MTSAISSLPLLGSRRSRPRVPSWVLAPMATECLLEAMPLCADVAHLQAEVLPLAVPQESELAGLLARVSHGDEIVHQRPYSTEVWCMREWLRTSAMGRNPQAPQPLAALCPEDLSPREHLRFALPPVQPRSLKTVLADADVYGRPGPCPVVFAASAWGKLEDSCRAALPNEALLALRGSLCRCPESGAAFTYVSRVDQVRAASAPDAVAATPAQLIEALGESGEQLVGMSHSHPQPAGQPLTGKVVITPTDLTVFRRQLRTAHMTSMIANVADGQPLEWIALSWQRGEPVAAGFLVARGNGSETK